MLPIFLAVTENGLRDAIRIAAPAGNSIWCGSDAITEVDFQKLAGPAVTRFIYPLQGQPAKVINDAIATMEEHHPGATIWIEATKGEP